MSGNKEQKKWDLFICHASEDKDEIVRPLKDALEEAGYDVWYDEAEIKLGDSLRRLVDEGLASSRYGLVILSPHFFEKHWTREELDGLTAREEDSKKVILPVWHNVDKELVAKYSPTLAGKYAGKTTKGVDSIVAEVRKVLKPSKILEEVTAKKSIKSKYEELHDFIRSKEENEILDFIRAANIDALQKQFEGVLDGIALFNSPNQEEDSKLFFFIEKSILERNEEDATTLARNLLDWYFGLNTPSCRRQILAMFVTFAKVRFLRKVMSESGVINLLVSDLGMSRSYDSAAIRAEILFNLRPVLSLQNVKDMLDYALANGQVGCSGNAKPYLMKIFTTTEGLDKEKVGKYKENWSH